MTRGQKGCYIYCTDPETNTYFAELAKSIVSEQKEDVSVKVEQEIKEDSQTEEYPGLTLKILNFEDVKPFKNVVPIYNLEIAAGQFIPQVKILTGLFQFTELVKELVRSWPLTFILLMFYRNYLSLQQYHIHQWIFRK